MLALQSIRPSALLGAALVAAAFVVPSARAARPDDSPPSYLYLTKESEVGHSPDGVLCCACLYLLVFTSTLLQLDNTHCFCIA